MQEKVEAHDEKIVSLTRLVKLLQSFSDGQESELDKLQNQVEKVTKHLTSQKMGGGAMSTSLELSNKQNPSNDADESLGGSSLQDNELAFQSLRAKQKLQRNLANNSQAAAKSIRDPLTQHQNLLNLVTEIDHQLKALEQRLNSKIADRDGILERMENQIEKLQKKNVKSSGYGLASVNSNRNNSSRSPRTKKAGVSPTQNSRKMAAGGRRSNGPGGNNLKNSQKATFDLQEFAERVDLRFEQIESMMNRHGHQMGDLEEEVRQAKNMAVGAEKLASRFADDALAGQEQLASQMQQQDIRLNEVLAHLAQSETESKAEEDEQTPARQTKSPALKISQLAASKLVAAGIS